MLYRVESYIQDLLSELQTKKSENLQLQSSKDLLQSKHTAEASKAQEKLEQCRSLQERLQAAGVLASETQKQYETLLTKAQKLDSEKRSVEYQLQQNESTVQKLQRDLENKETTSKTLQKQLAEKTTDLQTKQRENDSLREDLKSKTENFDELSKTHKFTLQDKKILQKQQDEISKQLQVEEEKTTKLELLTEQLTRQNKQVK